MKLLKWVVWPLFGLIINTSLLSCSGVGGNNSNNNPNPPNPATGTALIFPDPTSSTIALVSLASGSQVTYFGSKNANGIPQSVTSIVVQTSISDPSKTVQYSLDNLGRPNRATLPDGSNVTLGYVSTTQSINQGYSLIDYFKSLPPGNIQSSPPSGETQRARHQWA